MKILPRSYLIVISLFFFIPILAEGEKLSGYYLIQRQYENRVENDSTALPIVAELIKKAKNEKNYLQLLRGYKDALVFSPDPYKKLKYADSVIYAARATKDNRLLSDAYLGKGVVYYFNFKKYQLALNEYLKAYEECRNCGDLFHQNKLQYLIGVVKNYIGYYNEALQEFDATRTYFENEIHKDIHPNLMYGNQRGYYNTIHQMAVSYRNLKNYKKADSLVSLGLSATLKNSVYKQEHSYFLKEKGINSYLQGDYNKSIEIMEKSLDGLTDINDFAWVTVVYSYLGKAQLKTGNIQEAIQNFSKVDSIFQRHAFVIPEVRASYDALIDYYDKVNNPQQVLFYTRQLIKVDKILGQDFIFLSSGIHRNYDTKRLMNEAAGQQRDALMNYLGITVIIILSIIVCTYLFLRLKARHNHVENDLMSSHIGNGIALNMQNGTYRIRQYSKVDIQPETVNEIILKLEEFERNNGFLESGVTVQKLSAKFGISQQHLSHVINEYKGASFNRYISERRIKYITEKLGNEPKYLKYTIEALALECGIASRSNFSNLFHEINGIRPADFIKKIIDQRQSKNAET